MSFKDIQSALLSPITSNASFGIDWAWNNYNFEPTLGMPYGESFVLPNQPERTSLGDGGLYTNTGVYQITLRYPEGKGTKAIFEKADEIQAAYIDSTLTKNSVNIRIRNVGISPSRNEDGWFRVDLNIEWQSFT